MLVPPPQLLICDAERTAVTYRLPPLNGLRAFEAAARHRSFRGAADELCVTPGAVSQLVKTLETALDTRLFHRSARAIALTAEGTKYLPSIRRAFETIAEATEATAPGLRGRKLRLGIAPALDQADCPVLRRLVSRKDAPEIVGLRVKDDPVLLTQGGGLDALLRVSDEACAGLHIDRVVVAGADRSRLAAVLVTRPGIAGCHQHKTLVMLLARAAREAH
ncbi:MAG: LysR family transcriptional regulator [Rhodospirillales bacterium]|nr:LysR family transcriptional regulator [Rhodospirillales bacterium]